ncbi:MAG: WYL domain-containing protein [Firmicutes bacterium]|nr:WYL domain-containing protein [Bacillota bacterium]
MINDIITLNLDKNTNERISEDLMAFMPHSKKSSFISHVIIHYFDDYIQKYDTLKDVILNAIKKEDANYPLDRIQMENVVWTIMEHIERNKYSVQKKEKKEVKINIRIGKANGEDLENIIEHTPPGSDVSSFLRSILISYLSLPKNEREKIVYADLIKKIENAIKNDYKIRFQTNYKKYIASPMEISASREQLYNYLIFESDDRKKIQNIHIKNIKSLYVTREKREFSKDFPIYLEKMKRNGVQFVINSNIIYKLRLSSTGINIFNASYLERPEPLPQSNLEEGILYLDCSYFQLQRYFAPFYEHVQIIEPKEQAEQLQTKLQSTLDQYKKEE